MAGVMLPLLLLAGCTATTNVPEFKDRIHEVCDHPGTAEAVKSVVLSGDHEKLRVTMTRHGTETGRPIAGTPFAVAMRDMAKAVWIAIRETYPSKRFEYVYRDGNGIALCGFAFEMDAKNTLDLPVYAQCLTVVGPPEGELEWWQVGEADAD